MGRMIELMAKDGHSLGAYVAEPPGKPRGGLIVLQEIWGVNDHIRKVADGYAADGYMAVAPEIFDRVERDLVMDQYTNETRTRGFGAMQKVNLDEALLDIDAAAESVSGAGRTGVVGYCFGGRLAWLASARLSGLSGAVAYYGGGIPAMVAEKPKCPVLLHFGERDQHIPVDSVKEFGKAHPSIPIYMYPADHGFNCDQRESYDAAAAKLARERTLEFLREHIG
jgi:carboxymethylenebutenolidase